MASSRFARVPFGLPTARQKGQTLIQSHTFKIARTIALQEFTQTKERFKPALI